MGQVRHGSGTTPHAIQAAIQRSQASAGELSRTYGINPKTVLKWRKRETVQDLKTGPREPRSNVLSCEDEAAVVAFRRHTRLPLDDGLYALQPSIPHLTRSSLHRCRQRHGISRSPEVGDKPARRTFRRDPIGHFHIDIAELRTGEGRRCLMAAIDRTSKFAFARLVPKAGKMAAAQFLRDLIEAVPYRIHTVLTDNGVQFANRQRDVHALAHIFGRVCREHEIEPRPTKVNPLRTNGQVERMNRTIKDATARRHHDEGHEPLRGHLADFLAACNSARRLKTLGGLTPYAFICKAWTSEPERFRLHPIHQMPGMKI